MTMFPINRDDRFQENRGLNEEDSDFREATRDIPAHSGPASQPDPGVAGPSMFNLVQETRRAMEVQHQLLKEAASLLDQRIVINTVSGQTDASGNLDLVLYQVPQGMQFLTTRVNVEDSVHTPGAGFTAAGCWIALIRGARFAAGSIVDFLPNPPAANGVILPCEFTDGPSEGPIFRGGEVISLHVVGTVTLANVDILVRLQGFEKPL